MTNKASNSVSVIDTATNTVVAIVLVGTFLQGVVVTPEGAFVCVANSTSTSDPGSVSVIDTTSNTVVVTVPVGSMLRGVAITPF